MVVLFSAAPLWASAILEPSSGYAATDRLSTISPGGYDVFGDLAAVYAGGHVTLYDRTTWSVVSDLGDAGYGGSTSTFNSFVQFAPDRQSLWVGYTVLGNTDDRIYQVTDLDATPVWTQMATLAGNCDLAFSGSTAYVSGLNSQDWMTPNSLWRLGSSPGATPLKIAEVGGSSAGLDFDSEGNLYYASCYIWEGDKLIRYSSSQIASIQSPEDAPLTLGQAETLATLPFPACDTTVDAVGHVLFDFNHCEFDGSNYYQMSSTLAMWNGTAGSAANYDIVGDAGANHWYTFLSASGDVTSDGAAYLADGGAVGHAVYGLAEITHLLPGDADGNGLVEINDLNVVLSSYGGTYSGNAWSLGDFDDDSDVDVDDLNVVLSNYGSSRSAVASVPEPSSFGLLTAVALAAGAWVACRRR